MVRLMSRFRSSYDVVGDFFMGRQHLSGEFDFAAAERAAASRPAFPGEEEADQLPHGVQAEAAGHDRVALEVAGEEPEVGVDVQFGDDFAFAVFAAVVVDADDAVHHQHIGQRQLGVARAEDFAASAGEQFFFAVAVLRGMRAGHGCLLSSALFCIVAAGRCLCRRCRRHSGCCRPGRSRWSSTPGRWESVRGC